jgi:hypothetical protein
MLDDSALELSGADRPGEQRTTPPWRGLLVTS